MRRRDFMVTSAAVAAAGFGGPGRARAQANKVYGVTYLPPSYEALTFGSAGFVDYLKQNHGDTLSVEFYDSGRLLSADEQLPALRSGVIDFMFHTTSYVTRSLPILGICGLPGVVGPLFDNPGRLKMGSPLFELIKGELRKKGIVLLSLGGGIMDPEYVWSTSGAPVRNLDDIAGKRVRVVSFEATAAVEELGGGAVRIPSSELYLALQRGTVDAAVANIATINGRSIQEQIKYVLTLPVTAYGIGLFAATRVWDEASDAYREAMMDGARWFDRESATTANKDYFQAEYWPKFAEAGIEQIPPDEGMTERFREISADIRESWAEEVGADIGHRAIALAMGEEEGS